MKNDKDYTQAIEQAKINLDDVKARGSEAIGDDALDFMDTLLTPEEISESNLRVALIGELIKARTEKGISQRKLEELSGVKQPIISRMENGTTDPHIGTILKLLAPLGKTLAIVPMDKT
ncbi:MAG: helix-turn-helix transcriptional regulator [Ruminococcus sp.]|nr:helix-turn-helix transcriptional regulator [Ruminococcus sp.]